MLRGGRGVWALAVVTAREANRQPTTIVITLAGVLLILILPRVALFALGHERGLFLQTTTATIGLAGGLVALTAAVGVVIREIESRTLLVLLSKPISRGQVILGKYLGVCWTCLWVVAVLGATSLLAAASFHATARPGGNPVYREAFEATVAEHWPAYRPIGHPDYDPDIPTGAWLAGTATATWAVIQQEAPGLLAATWLLFWQTAFLAAVLVAGSTALTAPANALLGFSVFFLGHLMGAIQASLAGTVAAPLAWVLPNLTAFDLGPWLAREATDTTALAGLLASGTLTVLVYIAAALGIGWGLIQRRDLS